MCAFPVYQSAVNMFQTFWYMQFPNINIWHTHIYIYIHIYYTLIFIYMSDIWYIYIYIYIIYIIHMYIYIYIKIISINWPSEKTPHQRLDVVWNPLHKVGGILVLHVQHLLIDLEFVPHDDTEDSRQGRKGWWLFKCSMTLYKYIPEKPWKYHAKS